MSSRSWIGDCWKSLAKYHTRAFSLSACTARSRIPTSCDILSVRSTASASNSWPIAVKAFLFIPRKSRHQYGGDVVGRGHPGAGRLGRIGTLDRRDRERVVAPHVRGTRLECNECSRRMQPPGSASALLPYAIRRATPHLTETPKLRAPPKAARSRSHSLGDPFRVHSKGISQVRPHDWPVVKQRNKFSPSLVRDAEDSLLGKHVMRLRCQGCDCEVETRFCPWMSAASSKRSS